MARRKFTVFIGDAVLNAIKVLAARTGRKEDEVFEDALRGYLGHGALERIWSRGKLTEKDARDLAYRELHAARK
ncbi:MAG TPA: hypothetical protein VKZ50_10080 [bacterium]|nr:hypothetical protein [bacterium]